MLDGPAIFETVVDVPGRDNLCMVAMLHGGWAGAGLTTLGGGGPLSVITILGRGVFDVKATLGRGHVVFESFIVVSGRVVIFVVALLHRILVGSLALSVELGDAALVVEDDDDESVRGGMVTVAWFGITKMDSICFIGELTGRSELPSTHLFFTKIYKKKKKKD